MKDAILLAIITLVFSVVVVLIIDSLGDEKPNQPQRSAPTEAPFPTYKVQ